MKMYVVVPTTYEPRHDKTYNKTYVTSKDSDQPVHPPSMAKVLVYPPLESQEAVEGTHISKDSDQTVWMLVAQDLL